MNRKGISGMMLILLLTGMLTLTFTIQPVKMIACMDDYCWVDGESLDIGFSKYGEMISYDEATGVGVGLQYPGYETVVTHDQTDGTSRDPFANEGISVKYWFNGWLLELRYTHRILGDRRILAVAMFADMRSYGGDWIVGKELPLYTAPYGGRKTTAFAETEAIQVLDDDPQRFIALCTTHIYDWEDTNEDEVVGHPAETWPVVDVLITIIFNKAKKGVIVLKDVKLVTDAEILDSPVDCQFSNRGQWDMGPSPSWDSYAHFYHDPSGDIAQVISSDLDYVGWAAFCPHLSDYTVDGWGVQAFNPLLNVSQPDMILREPDIPFIIAEWDFTLDYVDPFAAQFSGATVYGISDLIDGDDQDIGPGHENVVDSAVVIEVPAPPDLTVFDPEIDGLYVWINGVVLPGTEGEFITRIHWDWGDGWEEDHWFPASHTYSSEGDYIITVTAYQSNGLTSTETKSVSVYTRVYIRADGSIKPDTAAISSVDNITYTFTDHIHDEIVVERDNIVVDRAGYTLQGTGSGTGIYLFRRSNVAIKNMEIKGFAYGIWLSHSSNSSISGNNIANTHCSMWLIESSSNIISGNYIISSEVGIGIIRSSGNTIRGNNLKGSGLFVYYSYQNIVEDNVVNSKPLVYLEDASDVIVESAGQVILVDCNNVRVENLDLSNATVGVELLGTDNTKIIQNNMTNNRSGIEFYESSNNIISENNVLNNELGILLTDSSGNAISGNNIINKEFGIMLEGSSNNTISGNNITSSCMHACIWRVGIDIIRSSSNTISGNYITQNRRGISLYDSSNNSISGNNITNNETGIIFYESSNNNISHNNFLDNTQQVYDISWDFPQHYAPSINVWDDGYPSGGNYWSDYEERYPNAMELDDSGIWDTPYFIDEGNQDNYPLMEPWTPIDELKAEIAELGSEGEIDNQGIVKSLIAKLNVAKKLVDKGKIDEAKSILEEDFIPQVQNLTDIHITSEAADILIQSAEHILSNL